MPWKVTDIMNHKIEFARRAQNTDNFSKLCQEYSISRKTGYKWQKRFFEEGVSGLEDVSRKPQSNSASLDENLICCIVELKLAHMAWGPKKIKALYQRKYPRKFQPSLSSVKRIFVRTGLTKPRKKRNHNTSGRISSGVTATHNNHIWTVDFKGWWQIRNGSKYEPLTIRDEHSRKILAIDILPNNRTECVQESFRKLFIKHGLPKYIRSDNGSPFANAHSLLGLTRLSVWWLSLGINLERSRPGKPQDNGAHERMHRDIRAELQSIGKDLSQESFDLWMDEYNSIRPHEALEMKSPDDVYENSARVFTLSAESKEICYGLMETRKVHKTTGQLVWRGEYYLVGRALGGRSVGLKDIGKGMLEVWFSDQQICYLNTNLATIEAIMKSEKGADKQAQKCNL
jgi:putative transposase